jgi:hypothetical protein
MQQPFDLFALDDYIIKVINLVLDGNFILLGLLSWQSYQGNRADKKS